MKEVALIKKSENGKFIFMHDGEYLRFPIINVNSNEKVIKQIKKACHLKKPIPIVAGDWINNEGMEVYYAWVKKAEDNEVALNGDIVLRNLRRQIFGGFPFYEDLYLEQKSVFALALYFMLADFF